MKNQYDKTHGYNFPPKNLRNCPIRASGDEFSSTGDNPLKSQRIITISARPSSEKFNRDLA